MNELQQSEQRNNRLMEQLLSIPFPFTDILREQLAAAKVTNIIYPDCYCLQFAVTQQTRLLPAWLDTVPLSWQVLTQDAPIDCCLFVKDGYVDALEIVDMGMKPIDWALYWSLPPTMDYEFDPQIIGRRLESNDFAIEKVHIHNKSVDFQIANEALVLCLRDCAVQSLALEHFPVRGPFLLRSNPSGAYQFSLYSQDDTIRIDCNWVCMQKFCHI